MKRISLATVCSLAVMCPTVRALAIQYTETTIGHGEARAVNNSGQVVGSGGLWQNGVSTPLENLPGGTWGAPNGINDAEEAVGVAQTAQGQYHATLWKGGKAQDLGSPVGLPYSAACDINSSGVIVGGAQSDVGGNPLVGAVVWSNGDILKLESLGGNGGFARSINDSGQIVGWAMTSGNNGHACFWEQGLAHDLSVLSGGRSSCAVGISTNGDIAGWSETLVIGEFVCRACLWRNGTCIDLGTLPGYTCSEAYGLNNVGQVVGKVWGSNGCRAFVWKDGVMQFITPLDDGSWANAINDSGWIVGQSGYSDLRAILWEPIVPEPSSILALAGGLVGLLSMRRRRA